jgi:hypothetical protein
MSEDAAYNRIETARAAYKYPVILSGLSDGSLNVTTVRLLARRLTAENHRALLAAASGRSKREVEELLAREYPQPDVAALVRKMPSRPGPGPAPVTGAVPRVGGLPPVGALPPVAQDSLSPRSPSLIDPMPSATMPLTASPTEAPQTWVVAPPAPPTARSTVTPLAEDRYLVKFTVSAVTRQKLKQVQDLVRHANPTGDPAEIFDRGLTLMLEELNRKRFAALKGPRAGRRDTIAGLKVAPTATRRSRHVSAAVKRAVVARDGGRCGFVGEGAAAATSERSWSSIMPRPSRAVGRRRREISSCDAARTTRMKRSCSSEVG